jgi:hypothetical protein
MLNNYATIGPVPVQFVSDALQQLEQQGWETRFVAFAGMVDMTSTITLQKPPPQPAFAVICCKETIEGETIEMPVIKIGGRKLENN